MVTGISNYQPTYPVYEAPQAPEVTNAVWYTTWTSWDAPIPENINLVNIFVGSLDPVMGVVGLDGAFSDRARLQNFVHQCQGHNPPIKVMVSIGGHGGRFDSTWNQLTAQNIATYSQALQHFCRETGVQGIDFDWEPDNFTQEQGTLVGRLIKDFKLNSGYETSLCCNSGTNWQTQTGWVFDAARYPDGSTAIDRLNIMAYYPLEDEQHWIGDPQNGWIRWATERYHFSPSQITVGMLSNAPDIRPFTEWDRSHGLSTGLWYWDPARPDLSNEQAGVVWDIYHPRVDVNLEQHFA